jgi:CheY-like chemotaxis protein
MKTVLVVEDGRAEQQLISSLLSRSGFEVVLQENAEDAWQWLATNNLPNLIVLDVIMPGQRSKGCDLNIIQLLGSNRKPILIELVPKLLPTS